MGFVGAVRSGYGNIFNFEGRATRSAYWWFFLWFFLLWVVMMSLTFGGTSFLLEQNPAPENPHLMRIAMIAIVTLGIGVMIITCFVPLLAAQVRRLHDIGRSGLWVLAAILLSMAQLVVQRVWRVDPTPQLHLLLLSLKIVGSGVNLLILFFLIQPSRQNARGLDAETG